MALETIQQLKNLLDKAKNVLIILPQSPQGDTIGAGWAWHFFLKKKGIESEIAFANGNSQQTKFGFLPTPEKISHEILGARDFVLAFATKYNKIIDVRTEKSPEELRIFITPEKGSIDPRDFSFIPASFKYDLVLALGCPDHAASGKIYTENPDIFFEVPVVNIDFKGSNENFGQINLVSLTASSVSEICAETLEQIDPALIDKDIAECLLAGIISATESFQQRNTTPKALSLSATLMGQGADQQKIVRHLYKTQPLPLLKLWGRVMARLKWDEALLLAWSPVYLEDIIQSRSNYLDIPEILNKIKENFSSGKIFLIIFNETPDQIKGIIRFADTQNYDTLIQLLAAEKKGTGFHFALIQKNIDAAEQEVLEKIRLWKNGI